MPAAGSLCVCVQAEGICLVKGLGFLVDAAVPTHEIPQAESLALPFHVDVYRRVGKAFWEQESRVDASLFWPLILQEVWLQEATPGIKMPWVLGGASAGHGGGRPETRK